MTTSLASELRIEASNSGCSCSSPRGGKHSGRKADNNLSPQWRYDLAQKGPDHEILEEIEASPHHAADDVDKLKQPSLVAHNGGWQHRCSRWFAGTASSSLDRDALQKSSRTKCQQRRAASILCMSGPTVPPSKIVAQRPFGHVAPAPARVPLEGGLLGRGLCARDRFNVRSEESKPLRCTA